MQNIGIVNEVYGLEKHGITNAGMVYWNLPTPALYEEAIHRHREAVIGRLKLLMRTGDHMGRSPNDRFVVREPASEKDIWWGKINQPFEVEKFHYYYRRVRAYLQNKELFVFDGYVVPTPATSARCG